MALYYITRTLEPVLKKASREYPAVILTGPSQSGKSTILKHVFGNEYPYVSLEQPDASGFAREDPQGFLETYSAPVILDDIHYAPNLLSYINNRIETNRSTMGQYLLSGSQQILHSHSDTELLEKNVAELCLLPFSRREIEGRPNFPLPWERVDTTGESTQSQFDQVKVWKDFLRGGFPETVKHPGRDIQLWHSEYFQTYLERDVRTLRHIGDLTQFQHFVRLLAARSAQMLNLTDIARDLGVAVNSIKAWLSVLEASFQVTIVHPLYANIGKRLVKTPKVYFNDVGTLCYLAGLREPEHAVAGPMGGAILETAVLSEIVRTITHRGLSPRIFFWRTTAGTEVDFVVESYSRLIPIEVKLSATPRRSMAASISIFQRDFPQQATRGFLIHPGNLHSSLDTNVAALPYLQI